MLRIEKHCLIPRKAKPMDAMNYIGKFGEQVVRENQVPVLFPEGSRTKDGKVGKFYSAGFRKLTESKSGQGEVSGTSNPQPVGKKHR